MNKIPTFGRSGIPVAGGSPKKPVEPAKAKAIGHGQVDTAKHPKGLGHADAPRHEPSHGSGHGPEHGSSRNPAHQRKSAP